MIPINSNFMFPSYAWLCALALLHRPLNRVKLILVGKNLQEKSSYFTLKLYFCLNPKWGNMFFRAELQIDSKNSNSEISESTLYEIWEDA